MGTVYEAVNERIGRRVAIKFLQPNLATNEEILGRFRREAQVAGSLEHEHIAAVTDFGVAPDGAPYMIVEYLAGEDLGSLLARVGPLPAPLAAFLIIQTCCGLDAAHARGLIHRDLKPENLFVCKRANGSDLVVILDFGIAKIKDHGGGVATRTGQAIGTPYYMSIEQARGAKDVDHRTDIYSLGVILYEILSGRKPHPGDTYNEIMYHILSQAPPHLRQLRPELPEELAEVVHRTMSNDLDARPASAAELARLLTPFAECTVTPIRSEVVLPVAGSLEATARAGALGAQWRAASLREGASTSTGTAVTDGGVKAKRSAAGRLVWLVAGIAIAAAGALGASTLMGAWRGTEAAASIQPAPALTIVTDASGPVEPPVAPAASAEPSAPPPPSASAEPVAVSTSTVGGHSTGRPPGHRDQDTPPSTPPMGGDTVPKGGTSGTAAAPPPTAEPPPTTTRTGRTPSPYATNNPYE